ncbi:MAG TPA: rhodanese-like domain-containing protein [Pyrinomonadaceae bacterium]|nr:rhodanese-like domain-containing protein [Pyrinomonadaceae bacterium]
MKTIVLLIALAFAACNSVHTNANSQANNATTPTPAPTHVAEQGDGVDRVTTAELEKLLKEGKAVVVDVRNKAMYDVGHIRGAKLIPLGEVGARADELPRDKMIVTYCS